MIERDFIMRMIQEAAQAIAALMGMRQGGQYDAMLQALGETYRAYFPFDGELLRNTEEEDFLPLVLQDYGVEEAMLGVLADLLQEEGQYWFYHGAYDKATANFKRGIWLLQYLNQKEKDLYSFERMNKLSRLKDLLDQSHAN